MMSANERPSMAGAAIRQVLLAGAGDRRPFGHARAPRDEIARWVVEHAALQRLAVAAVPRQLRKPAFEVEASRRILSAISRRRLTGRRRRSNGAHQTILRVTSRRAGGRARATTFHVAASVVDAGKSTRVAESASLRLNACPSAWQIAKSSAPDAQSKLFMHWPPAGTVPTNASQHGVTSMEPHASATRATASMHRPAFAGSYTSIEEDSGTVKDCWIFFTHRLASKVRWAASQQACTSSQTACTSAC